MTKFYNIISSTGSRNSVTGYCKISISFMNEKEIIGIASEKANRRGENLEGLAGIKFIGINPDADGDFESFEPSRNWKDGEELATAVAELQEDGYLYEIFKHDEQFNEFTIRAEEFGFFNENNQ